MSTGEWLASQPEGGPPGGDPLAAELAATQAARAAGAAPAPSAPAPSTPASLRGDDWSSLKLYDSEGRRIEVPPPLASGDPAAPRTAQEALDVAHRATRLPGSSTACVLRLDASSGLLDAANLGDSGFIIVRDGRLHFQSPAMQHFFDCPLQVGAPRPGRGVPVGWLKRSAAAQQQLRCRAPWTLPARQAVCTLRNPICGIGLSVSSPVINTKPSHPGPASPCPCSSLQFGMPPDTDWARDAAVFSLEVRPGDAIVLATDGLLDNLPVEDIVRLAPRSADEVEAVSWRAGHGGMQAADCLRLLVTQRQGGDGGALPSRRLSCLAPSPPGPPHTHAQTHTTHTHTLPAGRRRHGRPGAPQQRGPRV